VLTIFSTSISQASRNSPVPSWKKNINKLLKLKTMKSKSHESTWNYKIKTFYFDFHEVFGPLPFLAISLPPVSDLLSLNTHCSSWLEYLVHHVWGIFCKNLNLSTIIL
jgi:hypothetical protein